MTMASKDSGIKRTVSAQELLNELYVQIREYEQRLQVLSQNLQLLQIQRNDIEKAIDTIKSLDSLKPNHEVMLPLGAGVYGSFGSVKKKNLTVGVGSKIYLEKTPKATTDVLEIRLKKSEEIIKKLQEEIDRVGSRHQTLSQQFQLVAQRVQEAAVQSSVPQQPLGESK
jgi:prefoldin alpha subunit